MQYKHHHNNSADTRFLNIFFFPLYPRNIFFDKKIQTFSLHWKLNYIQASAKNKQTKKRIQNPYSISQKQFSLLNTLSNSIWHEIPGYLKVLFPLICFCLFLQYLLFWSLFKVPGR